uniref:Uncharacterized protein n=1 Tax=Fusarium oxysporum (strain Fo5176) TaxID=660025 RepID=A0A0C4DIM9_FUSOF
MAILSQVPAIEVILRMNNERMKEYRRSPEMLDSAMSGSANQVPSYHCYIASEAGRPYFIECTISSLCNFPKDVDALIFDVSVDGQLFATEIEADCELMDRDPKRRESLGQIIVEVWYGKQHLMTKKDTLNEPLRPLSKALFKDVIIGNGDVTHGTWLVPSSLDSGLTLTCYSYQNTKSDHAPSFCHYSFGPKRKIGIYHFHHRPYDMLVTKGVTSSGIHALAVSHRTISSGPQEQLVFDLTGDDD